MDEIHFFKEDVAFRLQHQAALKKWIVKTIRDYGSVPESINYIFCSDEYLLQLNRKFLKHRTLTDIITFGNTEEEEGKKISADIFISIPRVKINALKFNVAFEDELHRVMIHGVLHLLGLSDKSKEEKSRMRRAENALLSKIRF